MSKHKRFHGMHTKAQVRKAYAFFHSRSPYGSVRGLSRFSIPGALTDKKTAPSAVNTESGKGTKHDA